MTELNYRHLEADERSAERYSLGALEYQKIIDLLTAEAMSRPGRERCAALLPSADLAEVRWRQAETADFIDFVETKGELSLTSAEDIRPLLAAVTREAVPRCDELNRLARFLRLIRSLAKQLPASDSEPYEEEMRRPVYSLLSQLEPCHELRTEIERCVASDEDLHDEASPELRQIRRSLIRAQDEVKIVLERLLRQAGEKLQDNLYTMRNGRYVLPVKAAHKGAVKGLVHDASASGQTLFIEPMAVVDLNNKIRELEFEEAKEVERILKVLGTKVRALRLALEQDVTLLADLDFAQAKARLALKQEAVSPELNDVGLIRLRAARHPLIAQAEVVPIDFELGEQFKTLLITGPNTGGKTVSLKTCGLLSLMAMSGLAIPVAPGSEISVWQQVLADIGDEQSIEQSLSTFSAHLKNLIVMLELTGPRSLVLCDELGSGTDPSEGAALAIALIDAFRERGASIVATTHYQELKGYALNTPEVSNACCEFDTVSLRPTYRLLIGVPGVSNALAIAQSLGLDPEIIDQARALISDEGQRFAELISAIEQSKQEAVRLNEDIERLHAEAAAAEAEAEERTAAARLKEKEVLAQAEAEALAMIEAARAEIAAEIAQKEEEFMRFAVQSEADSRTVKQKEQELSSLKSLQSRLQHSARQRGSKLEEKKLSQKIARPLEAEDIEVGKYYRAPALNFTGQAVSLPDKKGQLQLARGQLTLTVPLKGLCEAEAPEIQRAAPRLSANVKAIQGAAQQGVTSEIKLIGMRVEDALHELDQAIDRALLTNLDSLRVVHGKGSGALRSAVRAKATSDRRLSGYREAAFGEGDSGVTYLDIRKK